MKRTLIFCLFMLAAAPRAGAWLYCGVDWQFANLTYRYNVNSGGDRPDYGWIDYQSTWLAAARLNDHIGELKSKGLRDKPVIFHVDNHGRDPCNNLIEIYETPTAWHIRLDTPNETTLRQRLVVDILHTIGPWQVVWRNGVVRVLHDGVDCGVALTCPVSEPIIFRDRMLITDDKIFAVFEGGECIKRRRVPQRTLSLHWHR